MVLTRGLIEALAPDRSALTASASLLGSAKWPVRARAGDLIWGECQGSGANPYRVAADMADGGAKCTCPSQKFPCKHGLALMLMCAGNADDFTQAAIPDWVTEWQGRRRGSGGQKPVSARAEPDLSPVRAKAPPAADPKTEAKKARRNPDSSPGYKPRRLCRNGRARCLDHRPVGQPARLSEGPDSALPPDRRAARGRQGGGPGQPSRRNAVAPAAAARARTARCGNCRTRQARPAGAELAP